MELANNYNGTLHLVSDIIRTGEPISVIVFHGLHSVLVSGVVATGNPLSDPGSIVGLDVWDPGYGIPDGNIQGGQEVEVPLSTWLSSTYYWGSAYSANYYGSIAADPDPVVGTPYTYNPGHRRQWPPLDRPLRLHPAGRLYGPRRRGIGRLGL